MSSTPSNNIEFESVNESTGSPAENSPVENSPVENSPAANAPVENAPVENAPVENSPGASLLREIANSPPANAPAANLPGTVNSPANNSSATNSPPVNPFTSNSQAPSPLTNSENNSQEMNFEATTSTRTSTSTSTTTVPATTTVEEVNSNYSTLTKTKKRRSTKQREADAGQKEMLDRLRQMYMKEFIDIPEKYRPKPKAYVARAAWYKKEGPERDKYIESWLIADKDAADARMGKNVGKKRLTEKEEFSDEYILDTLPSIVSEATGSADKFKPSTDTLRQRAKKAIEKMHEITDRAHDQLMKRIKQPAVRRTANYLFKETRKLTKRLAAEVNTQTRHLQKAAKEYIRRESMVAKGSIEKKAEANLTAALQRRPTKRMTHRLARLRNAGKGIPVKNFLKAENKAGRIPKTLKNKWKTSIPENATPLNTYND